MEIIVPKIYSNLSKMWTKVFNLENSLFPVPISTLKKNNIAVLQGLRNALTGRTYTLVRVGG